MPLSSCLRYARARKEDVMDNNFPVPFRQNRAIQVRTDIDQHMDSREVQAVAKEGLRHLIAIDLQSEKADAAIHHVHDLSVTRQKLGDTFMRQAFAALEANHRSPNHQAEYQAFHDEVVADYRGASRAIYGGGVHAIGSILDEPVLVAPPKRWWER